MKILLALDPFGQSLKALEEALVITKHREAELIIIAVAETFQDTELPDVGLEGGREALVPLVEKCVEKAKNVAVQAGVTPKIILKKGTAPDAGILKCAEEEKVELIVMGHRERKGLELFLLGSVATKVVTNAHCSVFVVR